MNSKVTYRQQFTRCGKQRCRKCREGAGHGPYWYAYWSENGRTVSKYIGIDAPVEKEASKPLNAGVGIAVGDRQTREGEAILRVYLLGQFRIEYRSGEEWQPVDNPTWHRRRARALLGCLLSNPGRRLGREQAMEALWPNLNIETAANRLNGAVHELRQILEPGIARPASSHMLRLEGDVLKLADASQIWVDAEAFEGLLNRANTLSDPEAVERILEEAALLYDGDYLLEELYSEWAAPRREALRRAWMGLLLDLADLRAARGAITSAIEPLDRLLVTDPTHETAVRRLMVLLTQLDRRGEALRIYQQLTLLLHRDYDADPLPETRELYEALKQGHIPAHASALHNTPNTRTLQQARHDISVKQDLLTSNDIFSPLLTSPESARQLGRHNQSPLIGRHKELDVMHRLLSMIEQMTPDNGTDSAREAIRLPDSLNSKADSTDRDKSCHFLLLMGEAGIGKTRLGEELSQEADRCGWFVAWNRAYEQEGTIPYRSWTQVLRTLLQRAPSEFLMSVLGSELNTSNGYETIQTSVSLRPTNNILKRLSVLLPELAANERDAASLSDRLRQSNTGITDSRLHLWEATLGFLSALSRTAPILIVLDDLHWTDDSSLELLAYLARHLEDERVLLVGTCRDAELAPTSNFRGLINDLKREQAIVLLPIQPLTQSQIGSLVAHLPQDVVQSIQTQAGGNPFFAEELARVSEVSDHTSTGSNGEVVFPVRNLFSHDNPKEETFALPGGISSVPALPESIAAVLERRLSRLSSDCQALLGKAAVLGGSFEFHQLLYMTGSSNRLQRLQSQVEVAWTTLPDSESNEDAVLDLLEEALAAGLLTEESKGTHITYHFWHPLIVSHLYERLSAARRAQLHRRAANALLHLHLGREAEVATAITYHLSKGGGDVGQIAHYAEIAGNRAYSLSAYSEAQYYYRQAISALTEGKSTSSLKEGVDPLHLACLLECVAECSKVEGNYEEVRHLYERALDLRNSQRAEISEFQDEAEFQFWRQQEAQIQALIWREIGRAWAATGEYARARQCYIHGKQVMYEAGVTSGAAWACLHLQYGNICRLEGNYEEAHRCAQEALEVLKLAMQEQWVKGDKPRIALAKKSTYPTLETRTARSILGDPLEVGQAHEILGVTEVSIGRFTEALKHLEIALTIFEQHDLVMAMAQTCCNLGAVHSFKAENSIARGYYRRSLELAERMGDLPNMAFVTGNLGDVAARSGDLLEAEEWFKRSLELSEHVNDPEHMSWCNVALATALQDQGNLRGALECIRNALTSARAINSTRCTGFALVALGDLRVTQAISTYTLQLTESNEHVIQDFGDAHVFQDARCKQFLLSAKRALKRALSLEALEVEALTEGQLVLASVYFMLGDVETARQKALQTREAAGEHELTRVLARSHRLLGRILAAQGDYELADRYFEQAIAVFREYEMRLDYARSLHGYGVTLMQRSGPGNEAYSRGLTYLSEAREVFANCKATIDLRWVEWILATSKGKIST